MVEEVANESKVSPKGVDTTPAIVGTGGGMGMGVSLAAVRTVDESDTPMAGTAIIFPGPEGKCCTD